MLSPDGSVITGQFQIDAAKTTCVRGVGLARGKSCRIGLQFAPTTSGRQTATLVVTDNASNGPQQVMLRGSGM